MQDGIAVMKKYYSEEAWDKRPGPVEIARFSGSSAM